MRLSVCLDERRSTGDEVEAAAGTFAEHGREGREEEE